MNSISKAAVGLRQLYLNRHNSDFLTMFVNPIDAMTNATIKHTTVIFCFEFIEYSGVQRFH